MTANVTLDDELASEIEKTVSLVGKNQSAILLMAIRAGLPVVASSHQPPRPEGFFADAYRDMPPERIDFEEAMSRQPQSPDR